MKKGRILQPPLGDAEFCSEGPSCSRLGLLMGEWKGLTWGTMGEFRHTEMSSMVGQVGWGSWFEKFLRSYEPDHWKWKLTGLVCTSLDNRKTQTEARYSFLSISVYRPTVGTVMINQLQCLNLRGSPRARVTEHKAHKNDVDVLMGSYGIWIRLLVEDSCCLCFVWGHRSAKPSALFREFKWLTRDLKYWIKTSVEIILIVVHVSLERML